MLVLPGQNLLAVALSLTELQSKALSNVLASPLARLARAAATRTLALARHELQQICCNLQSLLWTLLDGDARAFHISSLGLPAWPKAYRQRTAHLRLQILAWHRFALDIPTDDSASVWRNARPDRKPLFLRLLLEALGFGEEGPGPTPSRPPILSGPPSLLGKLDLTNLSRRALRAYPCFVQILAALDNPPRMLVHHNTAVRAGSTQFPTRAWQILNWDSSAVSRVWIEGSELLAVEHDLPLLPQETAQATLSLFHHPSIRWPLETEPPPTFRATSLSQRIATWKSLLGPFLCATGHSILQEGFVIPRKRIASPPIRLPNMKTVYQNPPLIDRMIAKYLICGVVSPILPHNPIPRGILPLGLVDKKDPVEPHRVIVDGRSENEGEED
eukprot:3933841-Rhodomonas_salina.2